MKNAFISYFYGLKVNKIIEYLTISDIVLLSGWGMVTPIIAVFFAENIVGGRVALAGLASTVYFLTKSILQLPFARYIDKKKGEWDDYHHDGSRNFDNFFVCILIYLCQFALACYGYPGYLRNWRSAFIPVLGGNFYKAY